MPSTTLLTNWYVIIGSHAVAVPNGAPPQHEPRMSESDIRQHLLQLHGSP